MSITVSPRTQAQEEANANPDTRWVQRTQTYGDPISKSFIPDAGHGTISGRSAPEVIGYYACDTSTVLGSVSEYSLVLGHCPMVVTPTPMHQFTWLVRRQYEMRARLQATQSLSDLFLEISRFAEQVTDSQPVRVHKDMLDALLEVTRDAYNAVFVGCRDAFLPFVTFADLQIEEQASSALDALQQAVSRFRIGLQNDFDRVLLAPSVPTSLPINEPVFDPVMAADNLREWLHITYDDLKAITGVPKRTIQNWHSTQARPHPSTVRTLLRVYALVFAIRERLGQQELVKWFRAGRDSHLDLLIAGDLDAVENDAHALLFGGPYKDHDHQIGYSPYAPDTDADSNVDVPSVPIRRAARPPTRGRMPQP